MFRLLISITDRLQQLTVGLLAGQEPLDKLLDIRYSCGCLDLLKGLVNLRRLTHLLVHLLAHESTPHLLNVQLVAHLVLALILALVGCGLCYLLVLLLSLDPAPDRLLLIPDAALYLRQDLLRIVVLLLDVVHQAVHDQLGL